MQLFKTQVKDPGMILKLHHPRTQKRSCSAKCHSAKSCKERMKFLQAVRSTAATIHWLLVAGRSKTNTAFLRVMKKILRPLPRKETADYISKKVLLTC